MRKYTITGPTGNAIAITVSEIITITNALQALMDKTTPGLPAYDEAKALRGKLMDLRRPGK